MKASELTKLARAKWRSSGLSDHDAKKLGLSALSGEAAAKAAGRYATPALRIPYFDESGKPSPFFRLRYLSAHPTFPTEKPQKYAQPKGTLNEVYLPPLLSAKWRAVMADPAVPLLITEGELKAAKACREGFATIGIGGVDVWRSQRRGIALLPQLEAVRWKDRSTVIVFDSDAASKVEVERAQQQLALALTSRGARVRIAALPAADDGSKQGLDDFLTAHGKTAATRLKAVIDAATEPSAAAELWALNDEVVLVREPPTIVVQDTGQRLSHSEFIGLSYANRHHTELINGKPKQVETARAWLKWPQRLEVRSLTYKPGGPKLVAGEFFNLFDGLAVEPIPGTVKPWVDLLNFLFINEHGALMTRERRWFEQWCAYPLRHPGAKLQTAVVLHGTAQGTGKSLVGGLLQDIYGANASTLTNSDLAGDFNSWADRKQFLLGEEITGNDQRAHADRLKSLITQDRLRINEKYVPSYDAPNCANFLFTSNNPDAFFVADQDRRFFVHEVLGPRRPRAFYEPIFSWRRGSGPAHLLHHLLNVDLAGFSPHDAAPMTAAKEAMIHAGKGDVALWVAQLCESTEETLKPFGKPAAQRCDLFTASQLLTVASAAVPRTSPKYLNLELQRAGLRHVNGGKPVRVNAATQRFYAVRNADRWSRANPRQVAEHWLSFFSGNVERF